MIPIIIGANFIPSPTPIVSCVRFILRLQVDKRLIWAKNRQLTDGKPNLFSGLPSRNSLFRSENPRSSSSSSQLFEVH